jgi:hypothetical protein
MMSLSAASRNNVPAVYGLSDFARDGGLLSVDIFRHAATYVDRILRGETRCSFRPSSRWS